MSQEPSNFASRAGLKLDAALEAFAIRPEGWTCADFGCNVGGFTDCLLQRGANKVYAIDTGYGALAWKLRKDSRVVVMERTNALHCEVAEPVDLVVIDVAWTPQRLSIPAAMKWLEPGGCIVSLLKPIFELAKMSNARQPRGKKLAAMSDEQSHQIVQQVCNDLAESGFHVSAIMPSVIKGKGGNTEYLLLLRAGQESRQ